METEKAIRQSAEDLRAHVERHRRLLLDALREQPERGGLEFCPHLSCPHERRLREVLLEAIEVLEGTRKAFKSKQLEKLRKRLIGVLAERA